MSYEVAYTDASVQKRKNYVGIGVWFGDTSEKNISCRINIKGKRCLDNNIAELTAILAALVCSDVNKRLFIFTDSSVSLQLIKHFTQKRKLVASRFSRCQDFSSLLQQIHNFLYVVRREHTIIGKVAAHSGIYGNECADNLAKTARTDCCLSLEM